MPRSPNCRAVLVLVLAAWSAGCGAARAPARSGGHATGLARPARIVTDVWGVPHLRAQSLGDLYFAWGWVTARDRLWQIMDLRQSADGQLWRWFGNRTLFDDGGAQLFELRRHAEDAWARDQGDSAAVAALTGYADGINAYMDRCRAGEYRWPAELVALGVRPADWKPSDSLVLLFAMGVLLDLDFPEVREGASMAGHDRGWFERRHRYEGQWIYDTIPDSAAARLWGGARPAAAAPEVGAATLPAALLTGALHTTEIWRPPLDPDARASNVFAVGARRSASGRPLLANDPHLPLAIPSPFHAVHVTVPGVVDAAGFYVPGIPIIVSGRNARCAWGITALGGDVVDVYADTLSPDGRRVRLHGPDGSRTGWASIRTAGFDMRFRVLGLPLPVFGQTRRYTPHGPVLTFDRKHGLALTARWAALEDPVRMGPLLGVERSGSAAEIAAHFRALGGPCLNLVAADRDGHVLYEACGPVPQRGWTPQPGPIPADGRHEWRGLMPRDQLPAWSVPAAGFVVNANNRPTARYPEPLPRFDWVQDRALEIAARLAALPRVRAADLASIQNDVTSRGAARMLPRLLACADSLPERWTPRVRAALDTLRRWSYETSRPTTAPTLYRGWYGALLRRSRLEGLQGLAAAALDGREPGALCVPGGEAPERAAVAALGALELALDSLTALLGPNPATWTWSRAHRAVFRSGMRGRPGPWEPKPTSVDGDNSTPCVGQSSLPWSTRVTHGPVFRHVVDLAVPDSSLAILPPGNSGTATSGHQADLLARWASHGYVPLYLSWERVEAMKESEITLEPPR